MFQKLYPTIYAESAYIVDFKEYYKKGYRAVVLDVDNTLVGHDEPADERAISFFRNLRAIGFRTCILSNNDEPRVKPFADAVDSLFVCRAAKPSPKGYQKAMRLCGSTKETTLFMGDQLFTDIWGANRAGIRSILVKPMKKDILLQIRLKRYGEKIIMPFYRRYQRKHKPS